MNNLYKEMVRKPGDLCFEVSLESDKGLTMTDLSFALKFFVYGHPKNVCIHKDDLEVVEGKYYAVLNEHGFVNGVLFCEAEIVETINGINRIVSVRSNTGYMIGNCCQPSVDTSSCAHGYSLSLYKVEYVPQPIDPNPEEDQLVAEELFGERLSLPELTADRAIADEHGNRIADTYETRHAVRNHIREVYNEQFTENPPLILEEYITPNMLNQDVKDMFSQAGATITNVPDGEDLTTKNGVLKLSDKSYNPGAYSGLGRVYLRKNLVGGQNLLTQTMVSKPNTIYIIQYDYTLDAKSITIPEGCVLSYEGGSIRDGHINYTDTLIHGTDRISNVTTSGATRHAALPTDEEDITGANGKNLKFKDKEYAPQDYSGLGRIYLRKNIKTVYSETAQSNVTINLLEQSMIDKPNTIYIIQYDYDLNGAGITIPEGCVLQFEGGMLSNGTVVGNNTFIKTGIIKIFSLNLDLTHRWANDFVHIDWFGALGDGIADDYDAIMKCVYVCANTNIHIIKGSEKDYNITKPLNFNVVHRTTFMYDGHTSKYNLGIGYGMRIIGNTGSAIIENIGTAENQFKNIGLVSGNINPSTIGIVFGRSKNESEVVLHTYCEHLLIDMGSNPSANKGIGTIGIYTVSNEESSFFNCDVWADCAFINAQTNNINMPSPTEILLPTNVIQYNYDSFYHKEIVNTPVSNTVFTIKGGRYISYGNTAPIIAIEGTSHFTIEDIFMQRTDSICLTSGIGYGFYFENYRNSSIQNVTLENARSAIVSVGEIINSDIKITMNALGDNKTPLIAFIEPLGGYRYIDNSTFDIINTNIENNRTPYAYIKRTDDLYILKIRQSTFKGYGDFIEDIPFISAMTDKNIISFRNYNAEIINSCTIFNNLEKSLHILKDSKYKELFRIKYNHSIHSGQDIKIVVNGLLSLDNTIYTNYSGVNFEINAHVAVAGPSEKPDLYAVHESINILSYTTFYQWACLKGLDSRIEIDIDNSEIIFFIKGIRGKEIAGEVEGLSDQMVKFSGSIKVFNLGSLQKPIINLSKNSSAKEEVSSVSKINYNMLTEGLATGQGELFKKGSYIYNETTNKPMWWTGEKWVDATGTEV